MDGKKTLRRSLIGLGAAAVLSSIIYVALYSVIKNSNAYLCATSYITNTGSVHEEFGEIEKVSLLPSNFYFKSDGSDGRAKMRIQVVGKNKEGVIVFSLRQESGKWIVKEANIL